MTTDSTRKLRLPATLAAGLLFAACAVFGAGKYLEHRQIEQCNAFLASIPASWGLSVGAVTGSLFGRSLSFTDIAFSLPSREGALAVRMDSATAEGIAFAKLSEAGKTKLADSLAITGMRVNGASFETSSEYTALTDFTGDPATIGAELGNSYLDSAAFIRGLGSAVLPDIILPDGAGSPFAEMAPSPIPYSAARYVSRADRLAVSFKGKTLAAVIGSSDILNLSWNTMGPAVFKDIQGTFDGGKIFSLAEFGLNAMDMPPNTVPSRKKTAMGRNPFEGNAVFEGGYIRDMFLALPLPDGGTAPVSLAEAGMTGRFADEKQYCNARVANLAVPKNLLRSLAEKAGKAENLQDVFPFIPETVILDGEVVLDITPLANGEASFSFSPLALSIADMGAFSVTVQAQGREGAEEKAKLRLLDVSLTDSGISELFFSLIGQTQGKTPSYLRREIRMGLSAAGLALQGPMAELAAHALDFLEKPGATLTVKIDPGQLTEAETLGMKLMTDPSGFGLSSSVSRAKPGEATP